MSYILAYRCYPCAIMRGYSKVGRWYNNWSIQETFR